MAKTKHIKKVKATKPKPEANIPWPPNGCIPIK